MSRSLSSIPKHLKADVIRARIRSGSMGLGYWAAANAVKHCDDFSTSEKEALLEKVKHDQGPVPDNWILSR